MSALRLSPDSTEGNDYVLKPKESCVWVEVNNVSVWIRRTETGVVVQLFPKGNEAAVDALDSCSVSFVEVERVQKEYREALG